MSECASIRYMRSAEGPAILVPRTGFPTIDLSIRAYRGTNDKSCGGEKVLFPVRERTSEDERYREQDMIHMRRKEFIICVVSVKLPILAVKSICPLLSGNNRTVRTRSYRT